MTATKVADFFKEVAMALGGRAKQECPNWLQRGSRTILERRRQKHGRNQLTPENLVEMIAIIEDGTISSFVKKVFVHLAKNGGGIGHVEKAGLVQISDPEVLIPIIHQCLQTMKQP